MKRITPVVWSVSALLPAAGAVGQSFRGIGVLPNQAHSFVRDMSRDGRVIVGRSTDINFRWSAADGMVSLGGGAGLNVYAVSPDGALAARSGSGGIDLIGPGGRHIDCWNGNEGCLAMAVAEYGATLAGMHGSGDGGLVVFRWTLAGGWEPLMRGEASGISEDGSVIVGQHQPLGGTPAAFVWSAAGEAAYLESRSREGVFPPMAASSSVRHGLVKPSSGPCSAG
jgi:uncharacterized membrane protein